MHTDVNVNGIQEDSGEERRDWEGLLQEPINTVHIRPCHFSLFGATLNVCILGAFCVPFPRRQLVSHMSLA